MADVVAAIDQTLFGQRVQIAATIGGEQVLRKILTPQGSWIRVSFSLKNIAE
eukprot:SAG31_NODE_27680_length_422_cov_0.640867_1_plen_51_part_10